MLRILVGGGLVVLAALAWGQEAYAVRGGPGASLWVAGSVAPGLDASNLKQLAWSKGGKSLAVLAADGVLRFVRLDGQSHEVARSVSRFRWSPASESLAFEAQGGIWTCEPGQTSVRVLDGEAVAWSPDGSRIAYSAKGSVWIALANGTMVGGSPMGGAHGLWTGRPMEDNWLFRTRASLPNPAASLSLAQTALG